MCGEPERQSGADAGWSDAGLAHDLVYQALGGRWRHPGSGALDFSDMDRHWVSVRDGARDGTLTKRTEGVEDVVARWDQLLRYGALELTADIGEDVQLLYGRGQQDVKQRMSALIEALCSTGVLSGALRIPNTVGDLEVEADLRARQLVAFVDVAAPQDRGDRSRVSWLVNQLKDTKGDLIIEAFPKNARTCTSATLTQIRDDRFAVLGDDRKEPHRFRLVMRTEMGAGRTTGTRSPGFITTVLNLINEFYGSVVQQIAPWQPPAPKRSTPKIEDDPEPSPPMGAEVVEPTIWRGEWGQLSD